MEEGISQESVVRTVDRKKWACLIGIGLGVYLGMRYLLPAAIPFLLGWMLASMVLPAAKWMERKWKIRRGIGGGILIAVFAVLLAGGIWKVGELLVGQAQELISGIRGWRSQVDGFLNTCCCVLEDITGIAAEKSREFLLYQIGVVQEEVQNKLGTAWLGYLVTLVKGIIALVGGILVVIIFGTLVLKDMEQFREWMKGGRVRRGIGRVAARLCRAGGRYLKAQVLIMAAVGLLCAAGFWLLGNPYFAVAGAVVGFLDALPLIGTGTILIPWALILCVQGKYMLGLGYFGLYLAADLLRQFLEPRLIGKEIGLHPALMLISVYGGFFLYGLMGFFLGPVSVLLVQNIWKELEPGEGKMEKGKE